MVDTFDKLLLALERCLMGTPRRQFTDEFKRESGGLRTSSGRPLSQIARELDQSEVASMRLTEPNGPMRTELAAALEILMAYPKVAAFGIADINPDTDVEGQMVQAVLAVIKGGIAGVAG
jgi:hypothetical protein